MPNVDSNVEASGRYSAALRRIAERVCWWKTAEETLSWQPFFLAQVMTYGTWEDVSQVRQELGDQALRDALKSPPPGVFDEVSWHYWHRVFSLHPAPPLPRRHIP